MVHALVRNLTLAVVLVAALAGLAPAALAQERVDLLITGVRVFDTDKAAMTRAVDVVIDDGKIVSIGGERAVEPDQTIDGKGKYLIPGIVDSNVHNTVYGNAKRKETVIRYGYRNEEIALESAQRHLKYGVTTVRDSYGLLPALIPVRDAIAAGEAVGARILAAGNIVGWGGPFSITFSLTPESELTYFQETWNDQMTQGVGEELTNMTPEEVREAINAYLDKGPDFIKFGGSAHFRSPVLIGLSPRVQKIIVDETHALGLIAETHATSAESLRLALEAGIDFIQHPEILSRAYPQELIDLVLEKGVICGMRPNVLTGAYWRAHMKKRKSAQQRFSDAPEPTTSAERNRRASAREDDIHLHRQNAETLIKAGCPVSIATDNYQGDAPELRRAPKAPEQEPGLGSLYAITGLVELGLTPAEAIIAGTLNGARAAGMDDQIGSIEEGKIADLVLLGANPLRDIDNIWRIETVIAGGNIIDRDALPEKKIFYTEPEPVRAP